MKSAGRERRTRAPHHTQEPKRGAPHRSPDPPTIIPDPNNLMPTCPPGREFVETFNSRKFTFNKWVNAEDDADGSVLAEFKGEDKDAGGAHFEVLFTISTVADTKAKLARNLSQAFKNAIVSVFASKRCPFFPRHPTESHGIPRQAPPVESASRGKRLRGKRPTESHRPSTPLRCSPAARQGAHRGCAANQRPPR